MVTAKPHTQSRTVWRNVHFASGLLLAVFVGTHLTNHLLVLISPAAHIAFMTAARVVYRNPLIEVVLLAAVLLQIVTGLSLVRKVWRVPKAGWGRLHVFSGLYLAFFLVIHLTAVLSGRYIFRLDTNLYFGAAGLNQFPLLLFFVPYYSLAILAFFTHVAAVHHKKMTRRVVGLSVSRQSQLILVVGIVLTISILYGLTGGFRGLSIPPSSSLLTR
ncbi:hypothetical protein J2I48_11770 [Fibrella sp. HMF5036]|uniref:Uncharacterized protein n=2 Tax=Fibrella aquatilis TaxID=2817059 RepID=A0A939G6S8_9BACT|nr:hypothetical protein [Fibrella aquatilis]